MKQIRIGNIKIDNLTQEEAVEYALDAQHTPCFVVTPNAWMLETCRKSPETSAILNTAGLSLADGIGVTWAARRQGTPLVARVTGIGFAEALLMRAAREGLRVFFLGGEEGVAERAATRMMCRYPELCVCGSYWGFFDRTGEDDRRLTAVLCAIKPDILFVCLGFPQQEEWIFSHLDRLSSVRVIAGLGGTLDVWSGRVRRAPRWISRVGLEWLWRTLSEPRRRLARLPALLRFGWRSWRD